LTVGLAITWALLSCRSFSPDSLRTFGFTPWYRNIARTTLATDSYARQLGGAKGMIVPEVQREPMYPAVLAGLTLVHIPEHRVVALQWLCATAAMAFCFYHAVGAYGLATTILFFLLMCISPLPPFYMSIMYPYAFQFSLIISGLLVLCSAIASQKTRHFVVAGIMLGCSMYERGAYLALPAFGVPLLLLYRRSLPITSRHIVAFLLAAYLTPLPWLIRDARLGVVGMNEMRGYALGYAYGALPGGPRTEYAARYEASVAARGTDSGTWSFIVREVRAGRGTWQANERRVARLVIEKMKANPASVRKTIWTNIKRFPSRLLQADYLPDRVGRPRITVTEYFDQYGSPIGTMATSDYAVFALALVGMTIGLISRKGLAGVALWLLIYTFLFSTLVTLFSPRYRGALDAFLLLHAAYALAFPLRLLARRRG
jgi:hypothetical protein